MAHEIDRMMYVGEIPWHVLGVRLPQNATYNEIIGAAGFFTLVECPFRGGSTLFPR